MSTCGALVFVHNGTEKTVYNHSDSYPSWLGVHVMSWLRSEEWDLDKVRARVSELRMVDEDGEPSPLERELYAKYADYSVGTGRDWYSQLRRTQGDPAAILEAGVAGDAAGCPLDSGDCEWAYVVDLDREVFEVYAGRRRTRPAAGGRWTAESPDEAGFWPCSLVTSWTFAELRAATDPSRVLMAAGTGVR